MESVVFLCWWPNRMPPPWVARARVVPRSGDISDSPPRFRLGRLSLLRRFITVCILLSASLDAGIATASLHAYEAQLLVRASAGTQTSPTTLVNASFSGVADISEGVVHIPVSAFALAVAPGSGFGGTVSNGALTASIAGAGPGSICPLIGPQERCIAGGGFGGVMSLPGLTQLGQPLSIWGAGGTASGTTGSGLVRHVGAERWTTGAAQAWFYIPEMDPTPFLHEATGSFIGLPSTYAGTGPAGFRMVTPMFVTGSSTMSTPNARGVASLTIRFVPPPVPLSGSIAGALLLCSLGAWKLRRRERRIGAVEK